MPLNKKTNVIKTATSLVLSFVLILSLLLMSSCSTPKVAAKISGENVKSQEFTTGEYLAYLNSAFNSMSYYYSGYMEQGMNPWTELTIPYGQDEDDMLMLPFEEYLVQLTQDLIIRQAVVSKMLEDNKIKPSEDLIKEFKNQLDAMNEDSIIALGFNKKSYANVSEGMYRNEDMNLPLYEDALFNGFYGKGGSREVTKDQLKKYYDENIYTYKSISMDLVDEQGGSLSDEEIKEVQKRLEGYLKDFDKNDDFDKVITQHKDYLEKLAAEKQQAQDPNAEQTPKPTETNPTETSPTGETQETGGEGANTKEDEKNKDKDKSDEKNNEKTDEKTDEQENDTDENLTLKDAKHISDADKPLFEVVKSVDVGKAQIKTYKNQSNAKVMVLVYRIDPNKTKQSSFDNEEFQKQLLLTMKQEEFNEEIQKAIDKVKIEIQPSVLKRCTPKQMEKDMQKTTR